MMSRITRHFHDLGKRSFTSSATSMGKKTAVVSTASRGLGLEFAKQLLQQDFRVICLSRSAQVPDSLHSLQKQYGNKACHAIPGLDLEDQQSIEEVCKNIHQVVIPGELTMLLNVTGILHDEEHLPEKSLSQLKREWLEKTLNVNFIGHVMVTQALFPLLSQSPANVQTNGFNTVVNLSARVGSVGDNRLGGWLSYRSSKTALNMFTKTLSIEGKRRGVQTVSLHPGTVDTGLSEPFQANVKKDKLFTTKYSVESMLNVALNLKPEDSGGFFAYDGSKIEW